MFKISGEQIDLCTLCDRRFTRTCGDCNGQSYFSPAATFSKFKLPEYFNVASIQSLDDIRQLLKVPESAPVIMGEDKTVILKLDKCSQCGSRLQADCEDCDGQVRFKPDKELLDILDTVARR